MRIRAFIFGFSFLVMLLAAIGLLPEEPSSQAHADRFWVLKTHGEQRHDVVVMGDSRTYRGVVPDELERKLPGRSVLNLGYSAGGVDPVMLELVERRLDTTGPHGGLVLIGLTPLGCTDESGKNEHVRQELARSWIQRSNFMHIGPVRALFDPVSPTGLATAMCGEQEGYFQEFHDDGWVASRQVPEDTSAALESYRMMFARHAFSLTRVQELAARIRKWTASGIRVMVFRPPVTATMYALEERASGFPEDQVRDTLMAAGADWVYLPRTGFPSYDGSHLREDGARAWSALLADSVNARLQGP